MTYTETREGFTITVWQITIGIWAYYGSKGKSRLYKGSVNGDDHLEALEKAVRDIRFEEVLDREG